MTTLDFRPKIANLQCRAGDTISFTVTAPTEFIAGRLWTAQVRSSSGSSVVDATFYIVPPSVPDGPAYLALRAMDTARLAAMGSTSQAQRITGGSGRGVVLYSGVWDCQIAPAGGGDPTNTLACGTVEIEGDVTRA